MALIHPKLRVISHCTKEGWVFETSEKKLGPFTLEELNQVNFYVEIAEQLGVLPKDVLGAKLRSYSREISIDELNEILSLTVKKDESCKAITFLGMLLAQTEQDQYNIAFQAESSSGKSYISLELVNYFPKEEQRIYAGASPTSFFHETGEWDSERKVISVDLQGKILIFVDQPHWMLMERLRPLLSHDQKILTYKITDRKEKRGLRTKTVELIGYSTVIFCTTKITLEDQERTRLWILSPEVDDSKLLESIKLVTQKEKDLEEYSTFLSLHPQRNWLKERVESIRSKKIKNIVIPNSNEVMERYLSRRSHLTPRDQRDYPRLFKLIKGIALLNCFNREETKPETIVANQKDVDEAFKLYDQVAKSNELGLSPEIYRIYEKVIYPLSQVNEGLDRKQIGREYLKKYHRPLANDRLRRQILPALESAGLIVQEPDPNDKRKMLVYPTDPSPISEKYRGNNSGVKTKHDEKLQGEELLEKLREKIVKGSKSDFEDCVHKYSHYSRKEATAFVNKLIEDGLLLQNPNNFWQWKK